MPDFPWFLGLPLLCSFLYVAAVMKLKYIARYQITIWQTSFYTNCVIMICTIPFLFMQQREHLDWSLIRQPLVASVLCWLGQVTTLIALERGDVSIATPVMGLKTLFVVLGMATVSPTPVPLSLWIAALLSVTAILLFQASGKKRHHHVLFTIMLSGLSALCYATFDVMTTQFRASWGNIYLPLAFGPVFVYSFIAWLCTREKRELPRNAKLTLWFGIILFGAQMLLFTFSIAAFGHSAQNNIVYNTRGLWSVLAVWLIGHWYDNQEQHLERAVMIRRLIGAALMLAAVFLAINP